MEVLFIVNEQAGNGKGKKVWKRIQQNITIDYTVALTTYPGHGEVLARKFAAQADEHKQLLVVVGGDGTIHEAINGTFDNEKIIIAVIPAGSGNDFARSFPVFKNAQQIERYIREGEFPSQVIDIGQMTIGNSTTHAFVNCAGIGFDAYVTTLVNKSRFKRYLNKIGLGKLSYALIVVRSLFTFPRFNVSIYQDGREKVFKQAWFIAISNQPFFGGGMKISPESKPNDGRIEVTIVHGLPRIKFLLIFATVFFGKHTKFKEITFLNGSSFDICVQTERIVCHADGEYIGEASANVKVHCSVQEKVCELASC